MTTTRPSYLPSRLFFLVLLGSLGVFEMFRGVSTSTQPFGLFFSGLGLLFLGLSSFFQPAILSVPLRGMLAASQAAAIGPAKLRIVLTFVGLASLFVGLFFRHVLQA